MPDDAEMWIADIAIWMRRFRQSYSSLQMMSFWDALALAAMAKAREVGLAAAQEIERAPTDEDTP